ncbi:hypothetical protein ACIQBJ_16120 [Kitasatospora sp. NPDC088391]|uniref:hypothetical protein n=1 Tax=Kitasatospora sp. NPDC088391 TaxID=3364074 RepID=UPI0037F3431E
MADGGPEGLGVTAWPPWPELTRGQQPVLVLPFDPARPDPPGSDWTRADGGFPEPPPGWSAVFDGARLLVRRPGGDTWFDGPVHATREWGRAVRTHRTLLLVTGGFANAFDFPAAAARGELLLLAVPVRPVEARGAVPPGQ